MVRQPVNICGVFALDVWQSDDIVELQSEKNKNNVFRWFRFFTCTRINKVIFCGFFRFNWTNLKPKKLFKLAKAIKILNPKQRFASNEAY